jgi:putative endonuclease
MTRNWWVYLLACRDGRTYTGIAIDVAARFEAHCKGKGAKFTRSNPPVRVLGTQAFPSKSEALKAEAALRKLGRPAKLAWAKLRAADATS